MQTHLIGHKAPPASEHASWTCGLGVYSYGVMARSRRAVVSFESGLATLLGARDEFAGSGIGHFDDLLGISTVLEVHHTEVAFTLRMSSLIAAVGCKARSSDAFGLFS